ncbi:hypothetical protein EAI_03141 [Harpegnathos saltator]|uniref:Uncharacterized protein n=1 Tax=Harpegnathos saltator TaxID=610380 RepID=E2B733_HARSA|nr:hypothetical protein EAI_03141 [Harpegnathos saltator]
MSLLRQLSLLVGCLNWLILCTGSTLVHEKTTEAAEQVVPRVLSRPKRYLIFPQGSNFQLVYCLTIGAYGRDGDLVLGLTAALAWELPNQVNSKISNLLHRRSRAVVYPKMEAFLQSLPKDGSRFERSEDRAYDHAYETSGDCERLYPTCRYSIYDVDF